MLEADGGGGGLPSMATLVDAAAQGTFAVNETGGQALLSAIRELAKVVDGNLADLNTVSRSLPLGSSNGAKLMKPYMQDVQTDDQGFFTRLKEFRNSLVDAEAAIVAAMKNYDNMEHGIGGNFRAV
jgi:hypothetical protein